MNHFVLLCPFDKTATFFTKGDWGMTRRWIVTSVSLAEMLIFGLVASYYAEWGSSWIHIPIGIWGVLIGSIGLFILWFFGSLRKKHIGNKILIITFFFMPLSMLLGITFAEPRLAESSSTGYSSDTYEYSNTYSGRMYYQYVYYGSTSSTTTSTTSTSSFPKLTKEEWEIVFYIGFVVIILFGSAVIPHFWVAAGLGALLILIAFVIVEFKADDREEEPRLPEYWPREDFSYSRRRRRR